MKRALPLIPILGLALSLAACAPVGPDYQLPAEAKINAPAAQARFVSGSAPSLSQAPVPDGWWRLYDDPRLNHLVEQAFQANADLRVAAANLERAQAVQRSVEARQEPRGDAFFAAEKGQLSGESFLLPSALPVQNLGDGEIRISYQLDLFGGLRRAAEAAQADSEATAAGLDVAKITIAAEVARSYAEGCAAGHELAAAERSVALQERSRSVIAQLAAAGRNSTIEVTRADMQLDQARASLPGLQARRRAAWYRLAILTGQPPGDYPREVEGCIDPPRLDRPIPVGDGAALLKRRPDIRQAERSLAAATARIGVATAALYPDITLGISYGSTGLLTDIGQSAAQHWGMGPLISWTIPGGGERARLVAAGAETQAALARFDSVVLKALLETETSLTVYTHDLERNAALRAARDHARQEVAEADQLYSAGRSPYQFGLSAQQSLAAAEFALAASDDQISADQIGVFLALGGGWSDQR